MMTLCKSALKISSEYFLLQFIITLTSDLLLQVKYHSHRLMEDEQFGLWLLALQVQLAHPTKLFEGLVDVSHP